MFVDVVHLSAGEKDVVRCSTSDTLAFRLDSLPRSTRTARWTNEHPSASRGENCRRRISSSVRLELFRSSNPSLHEVPFLPPNRSSLAQVTQQWPPAFLLDQSPSFPLSIAVPPPPASQPKRHPLRRDSTLPGFNAERRESSLWPFRTTNAVFHKQTSEIKENDLFLSS